MDTFDAAITRARKYPKYTKSFVTYVAAGGDFVASINVGRIPIFPNSYINMRSKKRDIEWRVANITGLELLWNYSSHRALVFAKQIDDGTAEESLKKREKLLALTIAATNAVIPNSQFYMNATKVARALDIDRVLQIPNAASVSIISPHVANSASIDTVRNVLERACVALQIGETGCESIRKKQCLLLNMQNPSYWTYTMLTLDRMLVYEHECTLFVQRIKIPISVQVENNVVTPVEICSCVGCQAEEVGGRSKLEKTLRKMAAARIARKQTENTLVAGTAEKVIQDVLNVPSGVMLENLRWSIVPHYSRAAKSLVTCIEVCFLATLEDALEGKYEGISR